jgi:ribose 1,5-bisphosphate isomerase
VDALLAARVERIAADKRHGSSWLAREAVAAVVEAARSGEDPLSLARELVRARPDVGAIAGALGRVLVAARTTEQLIEEADALIGSRERAAATIAVLLRADLEERIVMTHSASATAREALIHAGPGRVVCTVSDPGGEGRAFAAELAEAGLTTEVVADDDAEHAVGTVDILLLGADTVFRDGSLLNKVGTNSLADRAQKRGVPVIVACEVLKIVPADAHQPDENRVDLTPPDRIVQYATEEGILAPDEIAALVDRTPFLAEGYALLCA